jgi:hypothetical protein
LNGFGSNSSAVALLLGHHFHLIIGCAFGIEPVLHIVQDLGFCFWQFVKVMIVDFVKSLCQFEELFERLVGAEGLLDSFLSLLNLITLFYLKVVQLQMTTDHNVEKLY